MESKMDVGGHTMAGEMTYKTEIRDTRQGKASYGAAFVLADDGKTWMLIGHTKNYSAYPRAVRARTAAGLLCRLHYTNMRRRAPHFAVRPMSIIEK